MPDYQDLLIRRPYDTVDRVQLRFNFDKDEEPEDYEKSLSMTQQQFRDECDINNIIKQYQVTGLLPEPDKVPSYGDVSDLPSFQEAQAIIMEATDRFNALPSNIRARFDHNPGNFIAFMDNPDNLQEAVDLGLATIKTPDVQVPSPDVELSTQNPIEPSAVAPKEADS